MFYLFFEDTEPDASAMLIGKYDTLLDARNAVFGFIEESYKKDPQHEVPLSSYERADFERGKFHRKNIIFNEPTDNCWLIGILLSYNEEWGETFYFALRSLDDYKKL